MAVEIRRLLLTTGHMRLYDSKSRAVSSDTVLVDITVFAMLLLLVQSVGVINKIRRFRRLACKATNHNHARRLFLA